MRLVKLPYRVSHDFRATVGGKAIHVSLRNQLKYTAVELLSQHILMSLITICAFDVEMNQLECCLPLSIMEINANQSKALRSASEFFFYSVKNTKIQSCLQNISWNQLISLNFCQNIPPRFSVITSMSLLFNKKVINQPPHVSRLSTFNCHRF